MTCALDAVAKRLIDVVVASLLLLIMSPVLLVAALAVLITMGPPVLFRQIRPGLHSQPFTLYKLRTMREAMDRTGHPLSDEERITRLGRFLRTSSIDELPELVNVLKGDMSLVGPRPLLVEYLADYTPDEARRHEVRPGLTGWAQVHGRASLSQEEKLNFDLYYVDHHSLWMDLRILAATVVIVAKRKDIDWVETTAYPDSGPVP